ncbi:Phage-related protein, tail component, partial [Pasteurella testudinis DSM 23072]
MSFGKKKKQHTPREAKDTLRSAQYLRMIGLVAHGEIVGVENGWKDVYFNKTPVQNSDNSYNFNDAEVEYVLGTQEQDPLKGFDFSEKEISVSAEVKKNIAITRTVSDQKVTRLRITVAVGALFKQEDNGDTNGSRVDLLVQYGSKSKPITINGKTSSRYLKHVILDDLPAVPFNVTVSRITDDSKTQKLQNTTFWQSYTEIIDTKFSYPNCALLGIRLDSRQMSSVPDITALSKGRVVKIPNNYDPITRQYDGFWDGTFKLGWTNNPAFIFYDLVMSEEVGMGQRIGAYGCDKFKLYEVARWCDQLVDDGFGGKEPRVTTNLWLTDQRKAYDVLYDLASAFFAIPVWNGTQMSVIMDIPSDPVWTYTQANVVDGFEYSETSAKTRISAVEVEYSNPNNMYERDSVYVSDDKLIKRYGYNVKKIVAYGCTSWGQAYRYGRYMLGTNSIETVLVSFKAGREMLRTMPGDIFAVADNEYAATNIGGRVLAVNGLTVTLDREIKFKKGCALTYAAIIDEKLSSRTIEIVSANGAEVTLKQAPIDLDKMMLWTLVNGTVKTRLFRAVEIKENADGSYSVSGLQHEPKKWDYIEKGIKFEKDLTTLHKAVVPQPTHAEITAAGGSLVLTFDMPTVIGTVTYEVKLYKDGKVYRTYTDLKEPKLTFDGLPDGSYTAEIRAKNQLGQYSNPVTKSFEINLTITELRTTSELMAINVEWTLPVLATTGNATEIWHAREPDLSKAVKISTLAYPATSYLKSNVGLSEKHYFWARLTDKNGNKGKFTEAVFGEADHNADNLVNYLNGQITETALGKDLIAQLTGFKDGIAQADGKIVQEARDRADALLAEAQARGQAIAAEAVKRSAEVKAAADKAAANLLKEAQARGTAVSELQKVDQQQAQLITQATAKAESAVAGIEAEKTARAEADKAEAKARETLAGRVGTAESTLTKLNETVTNNQRTTATQLTVMESKFNNLSVGGRNYFLNTANISRNTIGRSSINISPDFLEAINREKVLTLSVDAEVVGGVLATTGYTRIITEIRVHYEDGTSQYRAATIGRDLALNYKGRLSVTSTIQDKVVTNVDAGMIQIAIASATKLYIGKAKLEVGNVATDWTPAPEDLDSAVVETNAKLTALERTTAEADKALAEQFKQMQSNVGTNAAEITDLKQTKASKTEVASIARTALESVWRGYADTAKNAAVSTAATTAQQKADTAKSQAIAAADTAAKAKADAAKAAAIAAASGDATSKANAAQAAAIADAALKDAEIKKQAAADAQTKANKAKSDAIAEAQKLNTATNAKITALDSVVTANSKASATRFGAIEAALGASGNLLQNSEFLFPGARNVPEGYTLTSGSGIDGYNNLKVTSWTYALRNEAVFGIRDNRTNAENPTGATNSYVTSIARFPVRAGQILQFSCYVAGWGLRPNSGDLLYLDFRGSNGTTGISKSRTKKGNYRYPNATTIATNRLGRKTAADVYTSTTQFEHYYFNEVIPEGVDFVNVGIAIRSNFGTDCYLFCCLPNLCEVSSLDAPLIPYTPGSSSAKITTLQSAIATDKQTTASQISTMQSSLNNATANISTLQKTVSDVSGKQSATHTVKTQVISGGRTAIAGIAMGATADNNTVESSVIVMADKFGVVKNASDGNVVPMLSIVDNKAAFNGDLIARGTITGPHIRAGQTLSSPVINGGSLNINNRFIVNSTGNVEIRSAAGNVGMIIRNERIDVYDTAG